MDFTEKDGSIWPMYVNRGGVTFNFCPGKATWDLESKSLFKILMIASESGTMYEAGGLSEQPEWWIDLLGWFLPKYNDSKFYERANSIARSVKSSGGIGGVTGGRNKR